jgi:hypothetical protein
MATTGPAANPASPLVQTGSAPPAKSQSELLGIITRAVAEVVNLKIITVVTPVTVGGTLERPTVGVDESPQVGAIATCINLLDGDITTAMDAADGTNADDPVRQYHEAQVQEAKEIVERNLKTIADLVQQLWDKVD